jgi:hypothetical protein
MTMRLPFLLALFVLPLYASAAPKVDYFFPAGAQRGTTVEVSVGGVFEKWPVKVWTDGKGVDVKPGKASGKLTITVAVDAEPGVYAIRLYDEQGASIARPFIVGTLPETLEKEPNDDPKKPQVLGKPRVVVNGRLDKPGDVDTFAVTLTKGQTLVASLEAYRTLRSPMDGVLQILSADGFVLEQNDDYHDYDPQIAFTAPKDGEYLVRVFAFPSMPDASIRFFGSEKCIYRLTLTTGPFVEYAYPLAVPRSAPGFVELVGWNIPDDLRKFPVAVRGDSLTPSPSPGGRGEIGLFHPSIANSFFVRLESNPAIVKTKATRKEPQGITMPVTINGRLDTPGDVDVYQFDAKKGQKLTFRIEARTLGFPLDPVLHLTDAAGKMLAQTKANAIGADTSLDTTASQDGTYRLEVHDLHSRGGMRYVYLLRAGPITPDFDLKVADDRYTIPLGKPLEIPVTIGRVGGFNQEITLSVTGLPKDVSATPTAKGLTLRLSADKGAFTGPIRIVGTAKDGTVRSARATVADLARTTDDLWLTVLGK